MEIQGRRSRVLPRSRVDVISIGAPLTQVLRASCVLARYDSTLQLETRDGALWAITTRLNPAAMRIVVPILPDWRDDATVCACDGEIFSDGIELTWDASERFDPVPRQRTFSISQRACAARMMAVALAHTELPDALGFWDELSEVWTPLSLGLRERDESRLDVLVSCLVGCGTGLTPTGDDFLQALLVTLATGDDADRVACESLKHALMPHLSRTTRISRAFLEEAMEGWAFGAVKDVLDELPEVTQGRMNALLGIGATSGPAYAFGVLMGLSWKDNCTKENTEVTEPERIFSMFSMA